MSEIIEKDWQEQIEKYLKFKSDEHGVAKNTILTYKNCLGKVSKYFSSIDMPIKSLEKTLPSKFIIDLKANRLSSKTIALTLAALKEFLKYQKMEDRIVDIPHFELPKVEKKLPDVLTPKQINDLLKAASSDVINRVIIEIFYSCGLRASELIGLKLVDINFGCNYLKVLGKGNKERLTPFGLFGKKAMQDYLNEVRPNLSRKGSPNTFLLTRTGKKYRRENIWERVKNVARDAGMQDKVKPHTLRHTCATHLLNGGADIRYLQEFLGHSNVSTTQIYAHLTIVDLKEIFKKYHPRA